jgi:dihydrofolate reductase
MARLLYSAAMSLDGFIAGPGGDMSWLVPYVGPNPTVEELVPRVGALLVGHRTATGDDPYKGQPGEGEAFGGGWSGPEFVVSHHEGPNFVGDVPTGIARAKAAAGDKYVNVLGADIARQCLELGELDEVLVCVAPVMLGDGIRLFAHPGGSTVELERVSLTQAPLATNIWFKVT